MCQFNFNFSSDASSLVNRAKQEIQRAGGTMEGDETQGRFQAKTPIGSIQGIYQIIGQDISLTITKKTLLLSCKRIQKELSEVMS